MAYIFHKSPEIRERERLKLIERYHDPATKERLLGTGLKPGWHCLEVGPGAGSILRWLSRTVGENGKVIGVDINPQVKISRKSESLEIIQVDIAHAPLPQEYFHVAHARFTLIHTPHGKKALRQVFHALRPGGCLVLEEPDFTAAQVLAGPPSWTQSVHRVQQAILEMFRESGLNPAFGLCLPKLIHQLGYTQLTVHHHAPITRGNSAMANIMSLSAQQLTQKYLATGLVTRRDINNYCRFAQSPTSWAIHYGTIAVVARKPRKRRAKS